MPVKWTLNVADTLRVRNAIPCTKVVILESVRESKVSLGCALSFASTWVSFDGPKAASLALRTIVTILLRCLTLFICLGPGLAPDIVSNATTITIMSDEENFVTRRSRRSTAGNRYVYPKETIVDSLCMTGCRQPWLKCR